MNNYTLFFTLLLLLFSVSESLAFFGTKVSIDPAKQRELDQLLHEMEKNVYQDLPKVLALGNEAIQIAEEIYSTDDLLKIYSKIGLCYENHNQQDSALVYYNYALEYAKHSEDDAKILSVYNDLAITYRRQTQYEKSKQYYLKAMEIARRIGDKSAQENIYHGLGSLYKDISDYENAIKNFLESIKLAEERGHNEYVVHSMQFLAITYAEAGKAESALSVIEDAVTRARSTQDTILNGIVLFDYGKILSLDEKYEAAHEKFSKSLKALKSVGHKPLIARGLFYLADNYAKRGNFRAAHELFLECEKNEQYISIRGRADLYYKMGELYGKEGKKEVAKEYYNKSLALADKQNLLDFQQRNHYDLYKIYEAQGNRDATLRHLTAYTAVRDSLFSEEQTKAITEMQFKYRAEKNEREIEHLQSRQERTIFAGIMVLLLLILAGLTGAAFLSRRNNQKLRTKNTEIKHKNIKLKESNQVLQQFAYVAAHDLKEPLRSIGSFTNLIQRRYGKDFNEEANEYMSFIQTSVKRMDGLLKSLLEYSGITIQQSENRIVSSKKVLQDVLQNLYSSITEKNARIEAVHLLNVCMSDMHLTQLLQNLVSNSIKYCDRTPHIQISSHRSDDRVHFTLTDNGVGLDPDHGEKVFNLFYQEEKGKEGGAGIGLAICKNIIEKYDGNIYYDSRVGEGTTFFFDLPAG